MDRSREFHSLLVMARNSVVAVEAIYPVERSYDHIHAQFQSLSTKIRAEITEARRMLLTLNCEYPAPAAWHSDIPLAPTQLMPSSILNCQPSFSLDAIKALATNVTKEIQHLKSFQYSVAAMNGIPASYAEHTLLVCKFLENCCRSLADQFEKILRREKSFGSQPTISEAPAGVQQMSQLPMTSQLTASNPANIQSATQLEAVSLRLAPQRYAAGQTTYTSAYPSALRGRYLTGTDIHSAYEDVSACAYSSASKMALHQAPASASSGRLESIESTVHELGTIFQQLVQLVSLQGETIQRIDVDIESAFSHADVAQHELYRFWQSESRHRSAILKAFGLLALVALFVFFFVV
ncbi:Syntaxin-5 [Mitosporidium daphniae]